MKQHVLSFFPLKSFPMIGMVLFLILFIGILIWVYRSGSDQLYKKMGELPLERDDIKNNGGV